MMTNSRWGALPRLTRVGLLAALLASARAAVAETPPLIKGLHTTDYRLARALGATMIRLWDFGVFMRGDQIEPTPGQWVDRTAELEKIRAAGLMPVCVLYAPQPWRCISPKLPDLRWRNEPSLQAGDLSPWMEFVAELTFRYRSQIRYWEVWNEPNATDFFAPGAFTNATASIESAKAYVEMVRQASIIIHQNDAGIVIGSGGSRVDGCWIWDCLAQGLPKYCDVISVHYGYTGDPDPARQLEYKLRIRALRAAAGGLPIWNTETSILRYEDDGGGPNTPEGQALQRVLRVNREAGVEAVFYYYLNHARDDHPENLANGRGGVRRWAWEFKRYR
jgi:hypothetical protein